MFLLAWTPARNFSRPPPPLLAAAIREDAAAGPVHFKQPLRETSTGESLSDTGILYPGEKGRSEGISTRNGSIPSINFPACPAAEDKRAGYSGLAADTIALSRPFNWMIRRDTIYTGRHGYSVLFTNFGVFPGQVGGD